VARVKAPSFLQKDIDVTSYGARGDGVADCSAGFRDAIEACRTGGGGRVDVPDGEYHTGPIRLRSGVELHLAGNAVIRFDTDPHRYLPPVFTRWEGVECMNYSPLIYAIGEENIAITGTGTLDGGGNDSTWWWWSGKKEFGWSEGKSQQKPGRTRLMQMGQDGVPVEERVMGEGGYLRPGFIQVYRCKRVLIRGIRIINSPMWVIHPVLCDHVTVDNVRVESHGPNNDGCDPESCRDVVIQGCTFDTGDDCIAIKSGRNNDGRRLHTPSEEIVIQDCVFQDGHGAVTIGSEVSGGARDIFVRRCRIASPVLYSALRIKTNAMRGGVVEQVYLRDISVSLVSRAAIDIDLYYEEGKNGDHLPIIRFISVDSMSVASCASAFSFVGYEESPLRHILLRKCHFAGVVNGCTVRNVGEFRAFQTTINGREFTPVEQ
jgi:polygalacturonase